MNINSTDLQKIFNKEILNKKIKINNVTINSKEVTAKSIFFAIKGKNTDGHYFVKEVIKKGSKVIVVKNNFKVPKNNLHKFIKVQSPIRFLENFAKYQRLTSQGKFVGVTGSFGKTTLKYMLSFFLEQYGKTFSSPKSFNNHFGLPLSLSNTPKNSQFNIFELGMSSSGEIDKLSQILRPDIGVITNIGPAHLKNFKNLKAVCLAKAEIMNHIQENGYIVLNKDDFYFNTLFKIANNKKLKIITFSKSKKANVQLLKIIKKKNSYQITVKVLQKKITIQTNTINDSFVVNFLATLCVCSYFNCSLKKIKKRANFFLLPSGRGNKIIKIIKGKKVHIIDESYNANPISMKNAIENFSLFNSHKKKKIAIIGDMLELGQKSKFYHLEVAKILNNAEIDEIYLVGKEVVHIHNQLKKTKTCFISKNIVHFKSLFLKIANEKSIFLIKGSNGIGLNKLVNQQI